MQTEKKKQWGAVVSFVVFVDYCTKSKGRAWMISSHYILCVVLSMVLVIKLSPMRAVFINSTVLGTPSHLSRRWMPLSMTRSPWNINMQLWVLTATVTVWTWSF